jgi:hypothetical protein
LNTLCAANAAFPKKNSETPPLKTPKGFFGDSLLNSLNLAAQIDENA